MNNLKINLLDAVEESFSIYAAMTIQDRAIVDARDGLKPAPRQCMYAQYLDKITYASDITRPEFKVISERYI